MLLYNSNLSKITCSNSVVHDESFSNIEELVNYKIEVFPSSEVIKFIVDKNERLNEIRKGNYDLNIFQANTNSVSLYVFLKCLFNC